MIKFTKAISVIFLLLVTLQQSTAQSTSWKGTTSTFWSIASNWTNGVPDSTKDVILGDASFTGIFQPKVNIASSCKSITIGGAVATTITLTRALKVFGDFIVQPNAIVDHPSSSLSVKGNWVNNGSYTTSAAGSRVNLNGISQTIGGSTLTEFRRLYVEASSTTTLLTNISITGTSSIFAVYGVLDPGMMPSYTVTSTGPSRVYGAGKIKVNASTFPGNYIFTGSVTYYSGSIVDYSSTVADQVVSSAYAYSTLMISGSGTKSLIANLPAMYSKNNTNGNIIVSSGTLDLGIYTANRGTTVVGGTLSVADAAFLKMSGTSNFPLNFATNTFASASTTEYYGSNQNVSGQAYGHLVISGSGIKTATTAFSCSGNLTVQSSALNTNTAAVTHSLAGNFIMAGGTLTGTNSTYLLNGTGSQDVQLLSSLVNLSVNKISGMVNLTGDITVTNTLQFTKGIIQTRSFQVFIPTTGTVTGSSATTGWVNGNLEKSVSTGASISRTFEIGNAATYTPASVVFSNVAIAGNLLASTQINDHQELAYSGIDSSRSVNNVWNFTNSGILFGTADITFGWDAADMDGGADPLQFKSGYYNGSNWSLPGVTAPSAGSIQVNGVTGFGEFAVGEKVAVKKWTGNDFTSDWFTPKNWFGGLPDTETATLIPNGISGGRVYPLLTAGTGTVSDMTIENAASLIVSNAVLQIAGSVTNTGVFSAADGTIEFNGPAAQTITSGLFTANSIKNLIVSNDLTLADTDTITGTLTLSSGKTLFTNDNLVLKSTENGTARIDALPVDGSGNATAFITGAVSIERYIPARKAWRLLGRPVKSASASTINSAWQEGAYGNSLAPDPVPGYGVHITGGTTLNGFDQSPTNSPSIKYYNNTTNTFTGLPATPGTMIPITNYPGYMLYIRGNRSIDLMQGVNAAITSTTLRMKGEVNTGNQAVTVNPANFTVMGNPYPSAIDFGSITRNNVKNSFYIWDPKLGGSNGLGAYVTVSWNSGTGQYDITSAASPVSQYIPSGEAVLIESLDGINPGTITIKESDKTSSGSDQLFGRRNTAGQSVRVNLFSVPADALPQLLDGTLTTYDDHNNSNADRDDARKLNGSSESIGLNRQGSILAIERRQTITAPDTSFLNLAQMKKQNYRLEIIAGYMDRSGLTAVIKDNYSATSNNIPLNMNGTTQVDFSINNDPASYAAGRFSIVFTPRTAITITQRSGKEENREAVQQATSTVTPAMDINTRPSVVVYPNPVIGNTVSLRFRNMSKGLYRVQLYNFLGQLVINKTLNLAGNDVTDMLEVNGNFPPGKYELMIEGAGSQFKTSVLKK